MAFTALLDACVLVPPYLCDTLLRCAEAELYRVLWSDDILEEAARHISRLAQREDAGPRRIGHMARTFPESAATGYEALIPAMTNDEKDRHVLAAAVVSGAQVIVTHNLKDFPAAALAPYHIEAQSPDIFLTHLLDLDPDRVLRTIIRQAEEKTRPPMTVADILSKLAPHAPQFCQLAQQRLDPA